MTEPNPKCIDDTVISGVKRRVEDNPRPDEPLLVVGYNSYSPRQILKEIQSGTPLGLELATAYKEQQK
jgi:hypothetical protein